MVHNTTVKHSWADARGPASIEGKAKRPFVKYSLNMTTYFLQGAPWPGCRAGSGPPPTTVQHTHVIVWLLHCWTPIHIYLYISATMLEAHRACLGLVFLLVNPVDTSSAVLPTWVPQGSSCWALGFFFKGHQPSPPSLKDNLSCSCYDLLAFCKSFQTAPIRHMCQTLNPTGKQHDPQTSASWMMPDLSQHMVTTIHNLLSSRFS